MRRNDWSKAVGDGGGGMRRARHANGVGRQLSHLHNLPTLEAIDGWVNGWWRRPPPIDHLPHPESGGPRVTRTRPTHTPSVEDGRWEERCSVFGVRVKIPCTIAAM